MKRRIFKGWWGCGDDGCLRTPSGKTVIKLPPWLAFRIHRLLHAITHVGRFDGWFYDEPLLEAIKSGHLKDWLGI